MVWRVVGWKIGWLVGHEKLIHGVMIANQWVQFSVATPLQKAVADILEEVRRETHYPQQR